MSASNLHRTVSGLALIAGALGFAAFTSPASAQCVEGLPDTYVCSGEQDTTQTVSDVTVGMVTAPGFAVDTISNGGGPSLVVTGQGSVTYIDENASRLAGGGARFTTQTGSLNIFSNGVIDSQLDLDGLVLDSQGAGDINLIWDGHIGNAAGNGLTVSGAGDIDLNIASLSAQDDGVTVTQSGPGVVNLVGDDIDVVSGAGVWVEAGAGAGEISIDLLSVSGGEYGVAVFNQGDDGTVIRVAGTTQADHGIHVENSTGSGEVFVDVSDVISTGTAVRVNNNGDTGAFIRTHDLVSGGDALVASNGQNGGDLTIVTRRVEAADTGVVAFSDGTGEISVRVNGAITAGLHGVTVNTGANTQNVDVETQGIQAGDAAIRAVSNGTGSLSIRTTGLVVGGQEGIHAVTGANGVDLSIETQGVQGFTDGILAINAGSGSTTVVTAGTVIATNGVGILVSGESDTTSLMVQATEVSGSEAGIGVENQGSGDTIVIATGAVSASHPDGSGVHVENGANSGAIVIEVANVSGGLAAVQAFNNGLSDMTITTGDLVGNQFGLFAVNDASTHDLIVETGSASGIQSAISMSNSGAGITSVLATGHLTSLEGAGVQVSSGQQGEGIVIDVQSIQADVGVNAYNTGGGDTVIRAHGAVVGASADGVTALNNTGSGNLLIDVQAVQGGATGITADNRGNGFTQVLAGGPVVGTTDGILVWADAGVTDISVMAGDVTGGQAGIVVENFGSGDTIIKTTGLVRGDGLQGLRVNNGVSAGDIRLDVNDIVSAEEGVTALNQGTGVIGVVVRGVIESGSYGVSVSNFGGQNVFIENLGAIRRETSDLTSVRASGGEINLLNSGEINGAVTLFGDSSLLFNTGLWNSAGGESQFEGADDWVMNTAQGLILAGSDGAVAESTLWSGLERFDSDARLSLIDGGAGDALVTSAATTFITGSTFGVDIGGLQSDLFRTTSALTIQPGSTLAVNMAAPPVLNERYVVAEAQQGVTGEFEFEDLFLTAFAGLRDGYTATEAYVEFAQLRDLAEAGLTPNQKEAAAGADSLPDGQPLKDALLLLPTDEAAQEAFDLISGELHASVRTAMVEDSRLPRDAVLDRLSQGDDEGRVWGRAFDARGVSEGDYNAARSDRDTRGVMVGADRPIGDHVIVGGAVAFLETDLDAGSRASSGTVETTQLLFYGRFRSDAWRVAGALGYGWNEIDTRRTIVFPGFSGAPTAAYDGSVLQGFLEAGYRIPLRGGQVEPFVGLAAVRAETDAFQETPGAAALSGQAASQEALFSTVGVRFETSSDGPVTLRGWAGWRRNWSDLDPAGRHAFDGGDAFTVLGAAQSENAAVANLQAEWRISPNAALGLAYDGVLGEDGDDHAITGTFKVVF